METRALNSSMVFEAEVMWVLVEAVVVESTVVDDMSIASGHHAQLCCAWAQASFV
jgi:hypothetical protein